MRCAVCEQGCINSCSCCEVCGRLVHRSECGRGYSEYEFGMLDLDPDDLLRGQFPARYVRNGEVTSCFKCIVCARNRFGGQGVAPSDEEWLIARTSLFASRRRAQIATKEIVEKRRAELAEQRQRKLRNRQHQQETENLRKLHRRLQEAQRTLSILKSLLANIRESEFELQSARTTAADQRDSYSNRRDLLAERWRETRKLLRDRPGDVSLLANIQEIELIGNRAAKLRDEWAIRETKILPILTKIHDRIALLEDRERQAVDLTCNAAKELDEFRQLTIVDVDALLL